MNLIGNVEHKIKTDHHDQFFCLGNMVDSTRRLYGTVFGPNEGGTIGL
jgi:hypothetical protein